MNIKEAKRTGSKRYIGAPCPKCGSVERYVRNYGCIKCRNIAKALAAKKKRQERGPVKLGRPRKHAYVEGPVKPKVPRYRIPIPVTDFEKWVHRSKYNKKNVAKRKHLTLEMYYALYTTHCPLLGIELTYASYESGGNPPANYASLDRIDPSKGYVEGNVQILSFRANSIKSDATLEELKLIVKNWK